MARCLPKDTHSGKENLHALFNCQCAYADNFFVLRVVVILGQRLQERHQRIQIVQTDRHPRKLHRAIPQLSLPR